MTNISFFGGKTLRDYDVGSEWVWHGCDKFDLTPQQCCHLGFVSHV